ncbi:Plastocyanin-like domain protein [Melia azedarach]|uniref:Plastocyanin-like domain protein n=1 Tax=Melia azedarach TaxID=155640 RepID=A0ACC1WRH9_MELAZ|nr:Plastocyanin-like domain protein [Melia azedarach]
MLKMGLSLAAQGFVLLVAATLLASSQASSPRTIVVGDSENWSSGLNYTHWAFKNSPFFIYDKLVFKYEPPSNDSSPLDVYLLPNLYSYLTCDFTRAKLVADPNQGGGEGFAVVLNQWRPYYFASSQGYGAYCKNGMKFFVVPFPRWY